MRDKETKELIPYEFTIKNTCDSLIKYDVNLEILNLGEKQLTTQYVSVSIDNGGKKKLRSQESIEPTFKDANEARSILKRRELAGQSEQTYALRVWLDESVTVNDPVMNKEFLAKISVTASITEPKETLMARSSTAFWQNGYRENISKIVFEDQLDPKVTSEEFIFDVSETKNKSIMAYLVETENSTEEAKDYIVYIQGRGGIKANPNSSSLFANFSKLKEIENIHVLDTSQVKTMYQMFDNCPNLTNLDVSHFDTSNVTNMDQMFTRCNNLISLELTSFNTSNVTTMGAMFSNCTNLTSLDVSHFDTSNVTNMSYMFSGCSNLTSLDLSHFDTSQGTNMRNMFSNCTVIISLDLSSFNTSNVTDMRNMFANCTNLTYLDVSSFDTSNVTNMSYMFSSCYNLTSLDLSNFNTSQVKTMEGMFQACKSLINLNISSFDTSQVTNMYQMFWNCHKLTVLDVSHFDTRNVTTMFRMFSQCASLTELNLTHFDTSNVTNMSAMFYNCSNLTSLDLSSFNTSNVTEMKDMFRDVRSHIIYGNNFVHRDDSNVTGMFFNSSANKPTHESWADVTF